MADIKKTAKKTETKTAEKTSAPPILDNSVFNAIPAGIAITDTSGRFLNCNRAFEEMIGYTRDEILTLRVADISHPEDMKADQQLFSELTSGAREFYTLDKRFIRNDDSIVHAHVAVSLIHGSGGEPEFVVRVVWDISNQRLVEDAIRKSEEKLQAIFDSSPDFIYITDFEGNMIDGNSLLLQRLGISLEEFKKTKARDFIFADDPDAFFETLRAKMLRYGEIKGLEIKSENPNGKVFDYEINARILKGTKTVLSFARDITDRKRAEEQMRMLSAGIEKSMDGICVARLDGEILYANPAWAGMHGYTLSDLTGKNLSIFHTGDQLRSDVIPFNRKVIEYGAYRGEVGHVSRIGETFPTWMSTTLLTDSGGNPYGLVGIARDITARKRAERELKNHGDRLELTVRDRTAALTSAIDNLQFEIYERMNAEEKLIGTKQEAEFYLDLMSHDLTNFNQTAFGFLSLMENKTAPSAQQIKYIDYCKRQLAKSENLISKIRAFSRVKNIEQQDLHTLDLNKSVAEAAALVKNLYSNKNIRIDFSPEGNKTALATDLLDSVLTNIIENAVKHTPDDDISIHISILEAGGAWEIHVADNGPGVPDEMKDKIFDRFLRIGKEKGMGLGLSLARAIVEKFSGSLRVEDRVPDACDKGSVFIISIPKAG